MGEAVHPPGGVGRRRCPRAGAAALLAAAVASAATLAGCGDTIQAKPIPHNQLETLVVAPFPVYWVGGTFRGLQITEVNPDPGGAFTVQYGNCLQGGQGTCTPPLRVVTSPDNSFVPGGATAHSAQRVRGVTATSTDAGRTIAIPTGGVIVSILASDARAARTAADAIAPINRPEGPGEPLPARLPDTGFGSTPLPSQLPSTVRPPG